MGVVAFHHFPWSSKKANPQPDLLFSLIFSFMERVDWEETHESCFQARDNVKLDQVEEIRMERD